MGQCLCRAEDGLSIRRRMIRLALNGFEEIRALSFDLSNRRLKVVHDGEVEPVTSKLRPWG